MSDLFSMLGLAARSLDAQRYGLDVTGQNIANINTPGYTRRSVLYSEVAPLDPWSPGGGVNVQALVASRAPLVDARLRFEQPASSREQTIADQLSVIETTLGQPGSSIDAALAQFYNTYGALSQNPTSATARQQVIVEGQTLSTAFNNLATNFQSAQRSADNQLRDAIGQVNALAKQIAELNSGIASVGVDNAQTLLDQQEEALAALSKLADVSVTQNSDGTVDLSIGNGSALVVGQNVYGLSAVSAGPQGFAQVMSEGSSTVPNNVTAFITGGQIGGLIQVRDTLVPQYQTQLDNLAYGVVTDVNALTQSGFDNNGAAGLNFFVQPAGATGAAQGMAVNGAVAADTSLVVASATTAPGNNDIARAIAALQDAPISGTATTPVDAWGNLVYQVATDARTATQVQASHDQVIQQLQNLRAQITGVSIDEEAAMLLKFQRSYEANAKFFQVTDQTLDTLMGLVRA
jgi:flagellar hook-associated protein 1